MISRLVATVVVGVFLGGHLPRVLVTGQHSWILWVLAAIIVSGAPHLLRAVVRRVFDRARRVRSPVH